MAGLVLSAVAMVLIVLGLLAFSSASSARNDAHRFDNERRSADHREVAAQGEINTVVDEGNKVGDQINKLVDAANQVTLKDEELTGMLGGAVTQYDAGNETSANATVNSRGRQILSDEQGLKDQENQALAEAQDAQNNLKKALSP